MSAQLIDAGDGLIEAFDAGNTGAVEKAKAAWAEAVSDYEALLDEAQIAEDAPGDDLAAVPAGEVAESTNDEADALRADGAPDTGASNSA